MFWLRNEKVDFLLGTLNHRGQSSVCSMPQKDLLLFPPFEMFHAFLSSADFFSKSTLFEKFFQEYHLCVKTHWIQIWVQSVFKGYEMMTLAGNELKLHTFVFNLINVHGSENHERNLLFSHY